MIRRFLLKKMCLSTLFIAFTLFTTNGLCQTIKYKEWFLKQERMIDVSTKINTQKKCYDGTIQLNMTVTIKNLQNTPLVFCEKCISDSAIFVSKNLKELNQNNFVYDLESFGGLQINVTNPSPSKLPFLTISKGQSFDVSFNSNIVSIDGKKALKTGKYVFIQTIDTWSDVTELKNSLDQKWAKEGLVFWTNNIVTKPINLHIDKLNLQNCEK